MDDVKIADIKTADRCNATAASFRPNDMFENKGGILFIPEIKNKNYEKEINLRATTKFPPFTTIIRILVSGEDEKKVLATTKKIYDSALQIKEKCGNMVTFLQAMASPVKRIQKKYRYQILARVQNYDDIIAEFYKAADIIEKDVSVFVERNPNNLR